MKKTMAVLAAVLVAGVALAGGWMAPVFITNAVGTATTITISYTNTIGTRVDLKSLWLNGANLTNGTMKLVNVPAVTNSLPVTQNGDTLYVNMATATTLETGGVIKVTGLVSATGGVYSLSVYTSLR